MSNRFGSDAMGGEILSCVFPGSRRSGAAWMAQSRIERTRWVREAKEALARSERAFQAALRRLGRVMVRDGCFWDGWTEEEERRIHQYVSRKNAS